LFYAAMDDGTEWWCLRAPLPEVPKSQTRLRKYVIPRSRSQRNLAILRRKRHLKPSPKQKKYTCTMCKQRRRLGRLWQAPSDTSLEFWYCEPCWSKWRIEMNEWYVQQWEKVDDWDWLPRNRYSDEAASHYTRRSCGRRWGHWATHDTASPPSPLKSTRCAGNHFDFIEIGTSHYHTFTQAIVDHPDGKPDAWKFLPWDKHPLRIRGIAIDMMQSYLDQLPNLPRVAKLQAAVSERGGFQGMYHVPLGDIEHWEKVFATVGNWRAHGFMRLSRGCSALQKHNVLQKVLSSIGMKHLARLRKVRTYTMQDILERFNVSSIGVLALDCEGHDCAILRGLMRICDRTPQRFPIWIWFESNGMSDELFGQGTEKKTIHALQQRGYQIVWGGGYRTGKRDTMLWREPDERESVAM